MQQIGSQSLSKQVMAIFSSFSEYSEHIFRLIIQCFISSSTISSLHLLLKAIGKDKVCCPIFLDIDIVARYWGCFKGMYYSKRILNSRFGINFKQQFNFMKTRSHFSTNQNQALFNTFKLTSEDKQVLQMGVPSKRQKYEDNCDSIKMNEFDKIPMIPQVKLSIEDMNGDPLELLAKLQSKYVDCGAVKLICPIQWNPIQEFKYPKLHITTRIQPIHLLKYGKSFQERKEAYTLSGFQELAIEFQRKYKFKFEEVGKERLSRLENEYWNLVDGVDKQTQAVNTKKYKVTVEYGADLSVYKYGSAFPRVISSKTKDKYFNYAENLYNLNNIYRSEKSLLNISDERGEFIGGINVPWVYVGMMFSTFCWHVEDSWINSINYSHLGSTKIWYFVPQSDKQKFDDFIQEKYGGKDVISRITYMINPIELVRKNIKVYKAYHNPREFICTFFKAYHCGFSSSFNVGQAVNFVVPQSLSYIKETIKKSLRPSLFCYQWLIYQNYQSGLKNATSPKGMRVKQEYVQMLQNQQKNITKALQQKKIINKELIDEKTKYTRHVCAICKQYLYLSFLKCSHCKKDYCFTHASKCCEESSFVLLARQPNPDRKLYLKKIFK